MVRHCGWWVASTAPAELAGARHMREPESCPTSRAVRQSGRARTPGGGPQPVLLKGARVMNRKCHSTYGWRMSGVVVVAIVCLLASCLTGHAQRANLQSAKVDMVFHD